MHEGSVPVREFKPLLDRMGTRLASWKMATLSFAGEVILINSILFVMPMIAFF